MEVLLTVVIMGLCLGAMAVGVMISKRNCLKGSCGSTSFDSAQDKSLTTGGEDDEGCACHPKPKNQKNSKS